MSAPETLLECPTCDGDGWLCRVCREPESDCQCPPNAPKDRLYECPECGGAGGVEIAE
jgi:hypothetical protein